MGAINAFDGPIVSPMRDRWKIRRSWGRDAVNRFGYTLDESLECFDRLSPLVIKIDGESRDNELAELSKLCGVELKTDWSVVNGYC